MDRFVLKLKLYKKVGPAVRNCAMYLREELKRQGEIVQGYAIVDDTNECLEYYWVEDTKGEIHDVCFAIAVSNQPSIASFKYRLVRVLEEEDGGKTAERDDENAALFKAYRDEPSKFWTEIPRLKTTSTSTSLPRNAASRRRHSR